MFACRQAYGAKQYQLLGQQLQRGLLISCIVVLLICGVWTQLHPLLLLLGAPSFSRGSRYDSLRPCSYLCYPISLQKPYTCCSFRKTRTGLLDASPRLPQMCPCKAWYAGSGGHHISLYVQLLI